MTDTFWLMTFFESVSLIGSQIFSNWLVNDVGKRSMEGTFTAVIWLAAIGIGCITWGWRKPPQTVDVEEHKLSYASILHGKS